MSKNKKLHRSTSKIRDHTAPALGASSRQFRRHGAAASQASAGCDTPHAQPQRLPRRTPRRARGGGDGGVQDLSHGPPLLRRDHPAGPCQRAPQARRDLALTPGQRTAAHPRRAGRVLRRTVGAQRRAHHRRLRRGSLRGVPPQLFILAPAADAGGTRGRVGQG